MRHVCAPVFAPHQLTRWHFDVNTFRADLEWSQMGQSKRTATRGEEIAQEARGTAVASKKGTADEKEQWQERATLPRRYPSRGRSSRGCMEATARGVWH